MTNEHTPGPWNESKTETYVVFAHDYLTDNPDSSYISSFGAKSNDDAVINANREALGIDYKNEEDDGTQTLDIIWVGTVAELQELVDRARGQS